ncbi:glycoside hydrolase family 88 protein [Bradyrhizobium canariense]|uniref:Unsaturated chondroitin disaccharide hydrolase n=1 Tax=Bradyrhizobium canariense TaxID=255045 RepID=A0A1H1T6H9_9BRAD|nr:glycoside hydrolase family 88 protein [Bradyrhizobium canariense]SDS55817.1 unsaturated chondroitin disaccharide hydrolase [Bradyrhizobium canariense]
MTERLLLDALDLCARKLLEDEPTLGVEFPYVTAPSGSWSTMPASLSAGYRGKDWSHGNWFCGFWVGLLLISYLRTGDEKYLRLAEERMLLVAQRAEDGNTHDIGFIFYPSAIAAHHITGEKRYGDLALRAAEQLRRRLIMTPKGSYISSWGPLGDERGRRSSAIDTMANLPLLYWAGIYHRDASFVLAGEAHAMMTRGAFIRPDHSTYHAVEYDLATGERQRGFTFQGSADESCWPRGQAWAIYGYVRTAEATGKREYLDLAETLADYYLRRTGPDLVPFWDFDDPAIPNAPRDSSASAIVASALLDLAALHPDEQKAAQWRQQALDMLTVLCQRYLATEPSHRGLLRQGCYSKPHNQGVESAVMFGDFFFAEALCSATMPGKLRAVPKRLRA